MFISYLSYSNTARSSVNICEQDAKNRVQISSQELGQKLVLESAT